MNNASSIEQVLPLTNHFFSLLWERIPEATSSTDLMKLFEQTLRQVSAEGKNTIGENGEKVPTSATIAEEYDESLIQGILEASAGYFFTTPQDMTGSSRHENTAIHNARLIAAYILHNYMSMPYEKLAKILNTTQTIASYWVLRAESHLKFYKSNPDHSIGRNGLAIIEVLQVLDMQPKESD